MFFAIACLMATSATAQRLNGGKAPKLVVGIIVDQMRWDYLNYYSDKFGEDGFKRLMRQGYNCNNNYLNYMPSVTACGHASVYTGSAPAIHGIAGNSFYTDGKKVYCCEDHTVQTVGSRTGAGQMSPRRMLATTMADQIKIAQDFKSKTVGVSVKDRGAILPAGHTANAAYWLDSKAGVFVSSTYYMDKLPEWAVKFNAENRTTDRDIASKPAGNDIVANMAMAAIDGEQLGQHATTDFLAVSFSSTDYIGHNHGTRAPQTEEVYVKLDKLIAGMLQALDSRIGQDNYLLFITADHAAAHSAVMMQEHNVPAGEWFDSNVKDSLNSHLGSVFGTGRKLVADIMDYHIYLDSKELAATGKDEAEVKAEIQRYLERDPQVAMVVDYANFSARPIPAPIRSRIEMGYCRGRSGDMQVVLQPGHYATGRKSMGRGTTHGTWCPYDTHTPLIFFGRGIKAGSTSALTSHADIAATICAMLGVQMPNGCVGRPITME